MNTQGDVSLDKTGELAEFRAVTARIGSLWCDGILDVLQERNRDLLSELNNLESVIDSLLAIPNKPPVLRKQWDAALANYEKTAMLCITYAKRHTPSAI